jgi:alpha-N-arabinofuranosidase
MVTLRGNSPSETNSITAPTKIAPEKETFHADTPNFHHVVPPYAIQVLELKVK